MCATGGAKCIFAQNVVYVSTSVTFILILLTFFSIVKIRFLMFNAYCISHFIHVDGILSIFV